MTDDLDREEKLQRLADALVEEVAGQSDEEIVQELGSGGAEEVLKMARADLEAVRARLGRDRLQAAKRAISADRFARKPRSGMPVASARQRLASAITRSTTAKITLAARQGEHVPDEDLDGLIEDAEDLGIELDCLPEDDS